VIHESAYADSIRHVICVQLAAIRQFEAMQARKDQDHQEEWMMRQREKTKKVADLPNGKVIDRLVQSVQDVVKVLGEEIDELEVRCS
jgi:dephospho-CoA kinase